MTNAPSNTAQLPLTMSDQPTASDEQTDETLALKGLARDAAVLSKPLETLAKLKATDAEALDTLAKLLEALPSGDHFARAVDELRARATQALSGARERRKQLVGRYEAEFIRGMREAGRATREAGGNAWRIGPIEIEMQRDRARARARYNREPLSAWIPVGSAQSLTDLYTKAERHLEAAALPDKELAEVFWWAYDHLRRQAAHGDASAPRVPLPEFYTEVRIALARMELSQGKPDRKLTRTEFPLWAFLYNLDRYRRLYTQLSADRRLALETGSQHDHSNGLAMIANGLDASDDHKAYCYIHASGAA